MNQYGAQMGSPGQMQMGQMQMGQMQMAPMPQQRFANPAGSCINPEHVRFPLRPSPRGGLQRSDFEHPLRDSEATGAAAPYARASGHLRGPSAL